MRACPQGAAPTPGSRHASRAACRDRPALDVRSQQEARDDLPVVDLAGWLEAEAPVEALRAGRPVRLVMSLEETFQAVRRNSTEIRVRSGFRADGTLVFRDIESNYLLGAYADIADRLERAARLALK